MSAREAREMYAEMQRRTVFQEGDKVIITANVYDVMGKHWKESGWDLAWNQRMSHSVGDVKTILEIDPSRGFRMAENGYWYPFFCIKLARSLDVDLGSPEERRGEGKTRGRTPGKLQEIEGMLAEAEHYINK